MHPEAESDVLWYKFACTMKANADIPGGRNCFPVVKMAYVM
jgi:hypothetical protein